MESSSAFIITRTRLFGWGRTEAIRLPASMATPVTVWMVASVASLPPLRESIMAGSVALNMDATKLIPARSSIRYNTPRCC